jgi:hypothetical protein
LGGLRGVAAGKRWNASFGEFLVTAWCSTVSSICVPAEQMWIVGSKASSALSLCHMLLYGASLWKNNKELQGRDEVLLPGGALIKA